MGKATDKDFSEKFARRLASLISARFGDGHGAKARAAKETKTGAQLARYLAGTLPGADKIWSLAAGLGCSTDDLFDFDAPIPEITADDRASTDKRTSKEASGADFDFFGPRWKMSERGLARFTDSADKVEAFVTALIRNGAPMPDVEKLGIVPGEGPPPRKRRSRKVPG